MGRKEGRNEREQRVRSIRFGGRKVKYENQHFSHVLRAPEACFLRCVTYAAINETLAVHTDPQCSVFYHSEGGRAANT